MDPSRELFPAGQPQPVAVWLVSRRGDRLETGGESRERPFDFGIKCSEAMDIMAWELATQALFYCLL